MRLMTCLFLLLSLCATSSFAQIDSGLVAYYPFTGNALDVTGNGHDASDIAGAESIPDRNGVDSSAFRFNGLTDYIQILHASDIDFGDAEAFAFSLWINIPEFQEITVGSVNDIISKWPALSNVPYGYALRFINHTHPDNPNRLWFGRYEGNSSACNTLPSVTNTYALNDGQWHHIVFQRTEDQLLEIYIDGVIDATTTDQSTCSLGNVQNLFFGLRTFSQLSIDQRRPFTGALDEVRIYTRALNPEDIQHLKEFRTPVSLAAAPPLAGQVQILPNPVIGDEFWLENQSELDLQRLRLYDNQGRLVREFGERYELSGILPGVYYLEIELAGQQRVAKKLLRR
ncbi:MAG: LamG-like jellyroll fold domain-containing protein [Bacteroidota bacterium]